MKTWVKPKASEVTWRTIFQSPEVKAEMAEGEYSALYYRITPTGGRPKFFWGELAWADSQRLTVDLAGFSALNAWL